MREYAFEIHERVKERKFLKPGKGLLWEQGYWEAKY